MKADGKKIIIRALFCLLIAFEAAALGELVLLVAFGRYIGAVKFIIAIIVAAVVLFVLRPVKNNALGITCLVVPVVCAVICGVCFLVWSSFASGAQYKDEDTGKSALYGGKSVLILAPHEDDEYNMAEGIIEEYIKYGSTVKIAFTTNGDAMLPGEVRMDEALRIAGCYGLSEDDIIFLGYGNQFIQGNNHIYNDYDDEVLTSRGGYTATYGLEEHPAYNDGAPYTRSNYINDIESLVLELRPDIIICCDYDDHADHAALSMAFEEAMGNILASESGYTPVVLKSFAYELAYYAENDYYAENIGSTAPISDTDYFPIPNTYLWSERVRLPVNASLLSRSLVKSTAYENAKEYESQNLVNNVPGIINGDKVFWQRRTDSFLYNAEISVSSGDAGRLNDFKLIDCSDLYTSEMQAPYYCGTWTPVEEDSEKEITVVLPEAAYIDSIVLYDCPAVDANVLNALVTLTDGTEYETGPLPVNGSGLVIDVKKENISGFMVKLLACEGTGAGICEVEAYSVPEQSCADFIKLQSSAGDFIYDYHIAPGGSEVFSVYASGAAGTDFTVECVGDGCSAELSGSDITVTCPKGKSCTVTVSCGSGQYSDTVIISNTGHKNAAGQKIEALVHNNLGPYRGTNIYKLFNSIF